jgi:hypothetical protein
VFPRARLLATLDAFDTRHAAMFSQLLRRHAAAGLYLASVAAALLSAASLVAYAKEPDDIHLFAPYSMLLDFETTDAAE